MESDRRMKVMTLVGTRPEVIKLSRVIAALDAHVRHVLVHSGQNWDQGLNQVFFDQLGIRPPDHHLGVGGKGLAETIAEIVVRADQVLERERPDALLLYGDTNTCLAVIPAKRRQIPVFHMEAGNRCFDQRVPEELNRKVVDHLADVNLPLTEHARRYLLAEGLRPETVMVTGSPMPEVLAHHRAAIDASPVLAELGLTPGAYFVVSTHREENVDRPEKLRAILATLRAVRAEWGHPVIVSTHPRTRQRLEALGDDAVLADPGVRFEKPFGFLEWVKLQESATCVLSDSGTLTEESSLLGFPAVMLREAHERPEGMDAGTVVMSGLRADRVVEAVRVQATLRRDREARDRVADYQALHVSKKVLQIVLSYTDYVNRTVWRKG